MDPFVDQLASLCREHVTRNKWVFLPSHAIGRTLGEPPTMLEQYRKRLGDPRRAPRRLAKPGIVEMLRATGLLALSEDRCQYVALTWDTPERAFFKDPFVAAEGGLPMFLRADGEDGWEILRERVGWVGYAQLKGSLNLAENREFTAALETMQQKLQPDHTDYRVAEAAFRSEVSAESIAEASSFRALFAGYEVVQSKGSYSVLEGTQTIAKIIPRRDTVFVGIRDSKNPERWFTGPLERVSIQGVPFFGLWVPVEHPNDSQLASLVRGLPPALTTE
jgi:hypothetical protein